MSKTYYTKCKLEEAVKQSNYLIEVFDKLGACRGGNTYQRIKSLIVEYGIDTSHFLNGRMKGFINSGIAKKKHFSEILVSGKKQRERSKRLRRALLDSGRPHVCEECGMRPEWNGKSLTLQVDHIDGNWSNCLPDNLRFLCPNCHSQTPTYCGQGNRKKCENCNTNVHSKSRWCKRCSAVFKKNKRKVERPSLDALLQNIKELGYVATGKKYGVSDNAIRKWIRVEEKRILISNVMEGVPHATL